MLITPQLAIPDSELHWSFVRSGGPGGQNVNKVASKAVLRWDLAANATLPDDVKERLRAQQRGRITTAGELIVSSERFRDQERNRQDCLEKLRQMVRQAAVRPKPRRPTRPSRGAREARLRTKRHRATIKKARRRPAEE
jgi:ribosome-associated protein